MANNYSMGTIDTNFNIEQIKSFQRYAFIHQSTEIGDCENEEIAALLYDDGEGHDLFDSQGNVMWDMLNFDVEAARWASRKIFDENEGQDLHVKIDVAFTCDKPRIGEFGGLNEVLTSNANQVHS